MVTTWDIDTRLLRYFLTVVTEGSIRGAADKLNIAASAISRQIGEFEVRCGTPLLERKPRGVVPTQAGAALADYARMQIEDGERFLNYLRRLRGLQDGAIRIACGEGFNGDLIENALIPFVQAHKESTFHLIQAGTMEIVDAVLEGRVDIGLAYDPPRMVGIQSVVSARQSLHAIMQPSHPLAQASQVHLKDLVDIPLALPTDSYGIRALLRRVEASSGVLLVPSLQCATLDMLRRLALSGVAVTFLPPFTVFHELTTGELAAVPLAEPFAGEASAHLIVRSQRRLSTPMEHLLGIISSRVRAFQPDPS
ncbi:LysR family transcriptional regulator [Komagataeibacter saccharivorans]|uniref:LysR family transcriptional regulator n=2 Tax=Komagataeibacter saccharivorans TaxID=265959 RepID=UPI0039ED90BE